jgi:hypothetical protein
VEDKESCGQLFTNRMDESGERAQELIYQDRPLSIHDV